MAVDIGDQFQRQIMAAGIGQRARLQQQALVAQLVGQFRRARRLQGGDRAFRLAVHEIDDGEAGRDLRARAALQAVVDLVLQQFGGLVEQIDRHQPVGEPADHLVAAPPDRGEIAVIVEQAERFDRRQRVGFAAEEQAVEGHRRLVLDRPGEVGIGMHQQRHAHGVEGGAIAVVLGIKMREQLEAFRLGLVAAPDRGERLERVDHVLARHVADGVAQQRSRAGALARRRAGRAKLAAAR